MKLKKILKDVNFIKIKGMKDIEIRGVCSNSKYSSPGSLFIAKRGQKFDGTTFIAQAINAGAIAIVTDIFDPFFKNITQIIVEEPNEVEPQIAKNYYENPSKDLLMIGITGTNGKTTTSYLIKHLLDKFKISTGLIGTIEYIIGENKNFSQLTTPDNLTLQKHLKEMRKANQKACVMEVSSHGLDQNRVENIDFDISVFTNFTQDHLDYHKTKENYFLAKAKLFENLPSNKLAILNFDEKYFEKFKILTKAKIISYGLNEKADVFAKNLKFSTTHSECTIHYKENCENFKIPLIGTFNIYNLLAAISVGISKDIPLKIMARIFKKISIIPGRLEKINIPKDFHVYIDFSHTEDGLLKVLEILNILKISKIITVFGCGGDRDFEKRAKMGNVAEKFSDLSIITSDNPRSENPIKIIEDIKKGFLKNSSFLIEVDRKKAISKAMSMANKDDIVLIAGKGHENYQIFSNKTVSFNDKEIVQMLSN